MPILYSLEEGCQASVFGVYQHWLHTDQDVVGLQRPALLSPVEDRG